jgi:uncharacterized low-complexity protein
LSGATLIGAGGTSGEIEVPAGESKVQVTVVLEAETKLTGKETLTLSVGDQESAAVGLGDGDCGVGSIESDGISGTGECSDGDKQATYVFTVDVNPNYGESQTYAYEFVGDKGGFNQGFEVVGEPVLSGATLIGAGGTSGEIEVPAGESKVQVTVVLEAETKLTGKETLTLSVGDQESAAVGLGDGDCGVGSIESDGISGTGECSDGDKQATYVFTVDVNPNYGESQTYAYEFVGDKGGFNQGFEVVGEPVLSGATLIGAGGTSGEIEVPAGESKVQVTVVLEAETKLTGKETLTLSVGDQESAAVGLGDGDCGIKSPDLTIEAQAACELEDSLSSRDAEFSFAVSVDSASDEVQTLDYILAAKGLSAQGYVVNSIAFDPIEGVSLAEGGDRGSITVDPGVDSFNFTVKVTANDRLTGKEALQLRIKQNGDLLAQNTASLKAFDCVEPEVDPDTNEVALYLLMDNSTSMLLPDPSTEDASSSNRMEAQGRVALYAYQQALDDAGYGFSRDGTGKVLSSEAFRDALINNSSDDLFSTLDGFEVIVDPDKADRSQPMKVHLISYGYAVDYGKVSFKAGDTEKALTAAQAILDVTTPNELYGNSIKGNSIWKSRDLPKPTADDRFQADGRLTSNLYSGTEMLGALSGLETLLQDQARSAGDEQPTTLISMVTDGRPERRAWWDTREGLGSDSIIGASIPSAGPPRR